MSSLDSDKRLVAGMRPGSALSMGHYHQILTNWIRWQYQYDGYFLVNDLQYQAQADGVEDAAEAGIERVIDLLAAGIDPGSVAIVVESRVPELAELAMLLSTMTPKHWVERDTDARLASDIVTWGAAGQSLLSAVELLAFGAGQVAEQDELASSLGLSGQIARRFNHLYGKEDDFESNAEAAVKKLGKKRAKLYKQLRKAFRSKGDIEALETARALIQEQSNLIMSDQERLLGYLEGTGVSILNEPEYLNAQEGKEEGSTVNVLSHDHPLFLIPMRAEPDTIVDKVGELSTDPGQPKHCQIWLLRQSCSEEFPQKQIDIACRNGAPDCVACKQLASDQLIETFAPIRERGKPYQNDRELVLGLVADASERSRDVVRSTLEDVRAAIGLEYR